eukprot:gene15366-21450_t
MNRLNKDQKLKVGQFRGITGATEKVSIECLKVSAWALEPSIDFFFSSGMSAQVAHIDTKETDKLFEKYKDVDDENITGEGVVRFCADLGVEPADIVMLVISFHMNAALMGEYTKPEFTNGMLKMGVQNLAKLKAKLPELRQELKSEDRFREIYNFAYLFSRERGQKCVQFETAVGMWQLLYSGDNLWPLLDQWCEFLSEHHNRAISQDTWTQLLDFTRTVKPDFSNFDEMSAWPYLIDEFVESMKSKSV